MLLEFKFRNILSFANDTEFSMVASNSLRKQSPKFIKLDNKLDLLTATSIWGPNSSGKTNLLQALWSVRNKALGIHAKPLPTFCTSPDQPLEVELWFSIKGVLYDYAFEIQDEKVTYEYLRYRPTKNRPRFAFLREKETLCKYLNPGRKIECLVDPYDLSIPFLRNEMTCVNEFALELEKMRTTKEVFPFSAEALLKHLRDLDFFDVRALSEDGKTVTLYQGKDVVYPSEALSSGLQKCLALLPAIDHVLSTGGVLLVDDLDDALHPKATQYLVSLFQTLSNPQNPHSAQLICTMQQSTELIDKLRADQVWFVEKSFQTNQTSLYSLVEFKGIKHHYPYCSKGYSLGRYGANPFIKGDRTW